MPCHAMLCLAVLCAGQGHTGPVNGVAVSPDHRSIASGSDDRTVRLWAIVGRGGKDTHCTAVIQASRDAGGQARGWRGRTCRGRLASRPSLPCCWHRPHPHPPPPPDPSLKQPACGCAHSTDVCTIRGSAGIYRVTAAVLPKKKLYCPMTVACPLLSTRMQGGGGVVLSVAFSLDGQRLITGNGDKAVRVWAQAQAQRTASVSTSTGTGASAAAAAAAASLSSCWECRKVLQASGAHTGVPAGTAVSQSTAMSTGSAATGCP